MSPFRASEYTSHCPPCSGRLNIKHDQPSASRTIHLFRPNQSLQKAATCTHCPITTLVALDRSSCHHLEIDNTFFNISVACSQRRHSKYTEGVPDNEFSRYTPARPHGPSISSIPSPEVTDLQFAKLLTLRRKHHPFLQLLVLG